MRLSSKTRVRCSLAISLALLLGDGDFRGGGVCIRVLEEGVAVGCNRGVALEVCSGLSDGEPEAAGLGVGAVVLPFGVFFFLSVERRTQGILVAVRQNLCMSSAFLTAPRLDMGPVLGMGRLLIGERWTGMCSAGGSDGDECGVAFGTLFTDV